MLDNLYLPAAAGEGVGSAAASQTSADDDRRALSRSFRSSIPGGSLGLRWRLLQLTALALVAAALGRSALREVFCVWLLFPG